MVNIINLVRVQTIEWTRVERGGAVIPRARARMSHNLLGDQIVCCVLFFVWGDCGTAGVFVGMFN